LVEKAKKKKKKKVINPIDNALAVLDGAGIKASQRREVLVIPTDIETINEILFACGGLPLGKVIELYAKESVGKSTFAYWLAGQVQKRDGIVALFDAEGAYVPEYGAGCGIDNDKLILPEFNHGEEALSQMKMLLATGSVDLIIADAMPAFQPLINVDQVVGEKRTMNKSLARAKMYTDFFNDLMGGFRIKRKGKNEKYIKNSAGKEKHKVYETNTSFIFINHAKDRVGVVYGERTYTPGGDSINFASSLRFGMVKKKKVQKEKKVRGEKVKILQYKLVRIVAAKNKLGIPFGEAIIKMFPDGHIEPASPEEWDSEEVGEIEESTEAIDDFGKDDFEDDFEDDVVEEEDEFEG